MKLSELRKQLDHVEQVEFAFENGMIIPPHFHLTELGKITRSSIDCGTKLHEETSLVAQLWVATDIDHRLTTQKFKNIIDKSVTTLNLPDENILVEYQGASSLETYSLDFRNGRFILLPTFTECKAMDSCGVAENVELTMASASACCESGNQCC